MSTPSRARLGIDINIRSGPQMRGVLGDVERIAAERPGLVLDWGCGHGQISHMLRERGVELESFDYREGTDTALVTLEHFPTSRRTSAGTRCAFRSPMITLRVDEPKLRFGDLYLNEPLSHEKYGPHQDPNFLTSLPDSLPFAPTSTLPPSPSPIESGAGALYNLK